MNALEQKVLELIGEDPDAPDVFTDDEAGMAPIRASISDAIEEIVMLTGSYKRQYFLPLREGQAFYRLRPQNGSVGWIADAWSVTNQWRLEQTDLVRMMAHDPRWMVYTGNPQAYMPISHDAIGFYPKPSASSNVIELTIVEIPSAYTADRERIKVRDAFQYAVVKYAVADFWASRGDAQEATIHSGAYLESLGLRQQYSQQLERNRGYQTQKEPWPTGTE